jgi:hypothetical protein
MILVVKMEKKQIFVKLQICDNGRWAANYRVLAVTARSF